MAGLRQVETVTSSIQVIDSGPNPLSNFGQSASTVPSVACPIQSGSSGAATVYLIDVSTAMTPYLDAAKTTLAADYNFMQNIGYQSDPIVYSEAQAYLSNQSLVSAYAATLAQYKPLYQAEPIFIPFAKKAGALYAPNYLTWYNSSGPRVFPTSNIDTKPAPFPDWRTSIQIGQFYDTASSTWVDLDPSGAEYGKPLAAAMLDSYTAFDALPTDVRDNIIQRYAIGTSEKVVRAVLLTTGQGVIDNLDTLDSFAHRGIPVDIYLFGTTNPPSIIQTINQSTGGTLNPTRYWSYDVPPATWINMKGCAGTTNSLQLLGTYYCKFPFSSYVPHSKINFEFLRGQDAVTKALDVDSFMISNSAASGRFFIRHDLMQTLPDTAAPTETLLVTSINQQGGPAAIYKTLDQLDWATAEWDAPVEKDPAQLIQTPVTIGGLDNFTLSNATYYITDKTTGSLVVSFPSIYTTIEEFRVFGFSYYFANSVQDDNGPMTYRLSVSGTVGSKTVSSVLTHQLGNTGGYVTHLIDPTNITNADLEGGTTLTLTFTSERTLTGATSGGAAFTAFTFGGWEKAAGIDGATQGSYYVRSQFFVEPDCGSSDCPKIPAINQGNLSDKNILIAFATNGQLKLESLVLPNNLAPEGPSAGLISSFSNLCDNAIVDPLPGAYVPVISAPLFCSVDSGNSNTSCVRSTFELQSSYSDKYAVAINQGRGLKHDGVSLWDETKGRTILADLTVGTNYQASTIVAEADGPYLITDSSNTLGVLSQLRSSQNIGLSLLEAYGQNTTVTMTIDEGISLAQYVTGKSSLWGGLRHTSLMYDPILSGTIPTRIRINCKKLAAAHEGTPQEVYLMGSGIIQGLGSEVGLSGNRTPSTYVLAMVPESLRGQFHMTNGWIDSIQQITDQFDTYTFVLMWAQIDSTKPVGSTGFFLTDFKEGFPHLYSMSKFVFDVHWISPIQVNSNYLVVPQIEIDQAQLILPTGSNIKTCTDTVVSEEGGCSTYYMSTSTLTASQSNNTLWSGSASSVNPQIDPISGLPTQIFDGKGYGTSFVHTAPPGLSSVPYNLTLTAKLSNSNLPSDYLFDSLKVLTGLNWTAIGTANDFISSIRLTATVRGNSSFQSKLVPDNPPAGIAVETYYQDSSPALVYNPTITNSIIYSYRGTAGGGIAPTYTNDGGLNYSNDPLTVGGFSQTLFTDDQTFLHFTTPKSEADIQNQNLNTQGDLVLIGQRTIRVNLAQGSIGYQKLILRHRSRVVQDPNTVSANTPIMLNVNGSFYWHETLRFASPISLTVPYLARENNNSTLNSFINAVGTFTVSAAPYVVPFDGTVGQGGTRTALASTKRSLTLVSSVAEGQNVNIDPSTYTNTILDPLRTFVPVPQKVIGALLSTDLSTDPENITPISSSTFSTKDIVLYLEGIDGQYSNLMPTGLQPLQVTKPNAYDQSGNLTFDVSGQDLYLTLNYYALSNTLPFPDLDVSDIEILTENLNQIQGTIEFDFVPANPTSLTTSRQKFTKTDLTDPTLDITAIVTVQNNTTQNITVNNQVFLDFLFGNCHGCPVPPPPVVAPGLPPASPPIISIPLLPPPPGPPSPPPPASPVTPVSPPPPPPVDTGNQETGPISPAPPGGNAGGTGGTGVSPPPGPSSPPPPDPGSDSRQQIYVSLDADTLPIQAGTIGPRTTARISARNLSIGTYPITFTGTRCDGGQSSATVTLTVQAASAQPSYGVPNINTDSLPIGILGSEYNPGLKSAKLSLLDTTGSGIQLTSNLLGVAGNGISVLLTTVKATGDANQANQPLLVSVSGTSITVKLATGSTGLITSTYDDLKNALRDSDTASALVSVVSVGTSTNVVVPTSGTEAIKLTGGVAASSMLAASDGEADPTTGTVEYTWSVAGSAGLPAGLYLDSATGAIFGIPQEVGEFSVTFHLSDGYRGRTSKQLTLSVFEKTPSAVIEQGDIRVLPTGAVSDPEILLLPAAPIPDVPQETLQVVDDGRRGFWGPPPLYETLLSADGYIEGPISWEGEANWVLLDLSTPSTSGPWTELRVQIEARRNPSNPDSPKTVLLTRPTSRGLSLRSASEMASTPLTDQWETIEVVWRGVWYAEEFTNLGIRIEPRGMSSLGEATAMTNTLQIRSIQAFIRAIPMPALTLNVQPLIAGIPAGVQQLSPELDDAYQTYSLVWTGRWSAEELEDLSVTVGANIKRDRSNTATPWMMMRALEVEINSEPPPEVPVVVPSLPDLLRVEIDPVEASDLESHVFNVRITSNTYDGNVFTQFSPVSTNPGIAATFSDDSFPITLGETVQVSLTLTNIGAATGSVFKFQVLAVASNGRGSGSSEVGTLYVNRPAPDPLTNDVIIPGATEFYVNSVPNVQTCPTSGTTTFTLRLIAPLGTTPVSVSAAVRPTPATGTFLVSVTPTTVLPAPGLVRTMVVQVNAYDVPEDTYSIDYMCIGSDGNTINARSVLVVDGPPVSPLPSLPPLPPVVALPSPTIVETLVPNAFLRQTGILNGGYLNINDGIDAPNDQTSVLMSFGPPPLTDLAAIDLNMTDPQSDTFWTQITLRVRLKLIRDVQNPTFTFQPVVENQPIGNLYSVTRQQGLSITPNNFAYTWEGSWTTSQIRNLVVQVSGYTTADQTELNGIEILEVDAVVAGVLNQPAPQMSPFRLYPTGEISSVGTWTWHGASDYTAVTDDADCADDTKYALLSLPPGETATITFNLSDPPITAQWEQTQARARVLLENGASPVGFQASLKFPGTDLQYGSAIALPAGSWYTYRQIYAGTWTDVEIEGTTLVLTITNNDPAITASIRISATDMIASGVPDATEDWKLIPLDFSQQFGTSVGAVTDIYEGLKWPPDLPAGIDASILDALPVRTSPDPLPLGPQASVTSPNDTNYMVIPLSDEGQWAQLVFDISDPPTPTLTLSPPGPPPGPPSYGTDIYTAIKVRIRLQQDPRVIYPTITDVTPIPVLQFRTSSNNLPNGTINTPYGSPTTPTLGVTGGVPPYTWNIYIVDPQGSNFAGLPPGMSYSVDPDNSSNFFLDGTPAEVGIYEFGIAVVDSRSTVIRATFFLTISEPAVPPPSPPPPPPPLVSPPPPGGPVLPPPPVSPPPSPPIPDLSLFFPGYTEGTDPDTGIIWYSGSSYTCPSGKTCKPIQKIQFAEIGDTVSIPGKMYELAGVARTNLAFTDTVNPTTTTTTGVLATIEGASSGSSPATVVPASGSVPITLRVQYSGPINVQETGSLTIGVSGRPDKYGNPTGTGSASTDIDYEYLGVVSITTTSPLSNAYVSVPYASVLTAIGGKPPYNWAIIALQGYGLPAGLTMSAAGLISGVPILTGSYGFKVAVTDSAGRVTTALLELPVLSYSLSPPPASPPPPTSPVSPPPPASPPGGSPPPPTSPSPPSNVVDPSPDITVRLQPILPNDCLSNQAYGLGPRTINGFLIPRPTDGTTGDPAEGKWENFEFTWYGAWTNTQLENLSVQVEAYLDGTIAAGVRNNLYVSAMDVIATRASGPQISIWPASALPQGRLQWLSTRQSGDRGWTTGKWTNQDIMPYRAGTYTVDGSDYGFSGYIDRILGTAHKGGANQISANAVVNKYEIYGWLDANGDAQANFKDLRVTANGILQSSITPTTTTLKVGNLYALQDPKNKPRLGFLIGDELIEVESRDVDWDNGTLTNVLRGVNETIAQSHSANTPIFLVPYWERLYQVRIAGKATDDPSANAIGWDTPPNTDDGTPANLLQWGPIDLRPYSGDHPIRWILRLRVIDIYGITTETNILDPALKDQFATVGPNAHFGLDGNPDIGVDPKRLLYVRQVKPPGSPKIEGSQ